MITLLKRFSVGVFGSAFGSAANLLLSLVILLTQSTESFGFYSFFQVLVSFGFGAVNSIIGSPLSILIGKDGSKQTSLLSFLNFSFLLSALISIIIFIVFIFLSMSYYTATLYSIASFFMLLRWCYRAICHANSLPINVMKSDFFYSLFIFAGAALIYINGQTTITTVILCLIIGSLGSIFFLGKKFLSWVVLGTFVFEFKKFNSYFQAYGKWSFIGVCATEITANSHVYIVTIFFGSETYATIAAALLLYKPIMVVIMSLTQMERPSLAKLLASKNKVALIEKYKNFSTMIYIAFTFNCFFVFLFFYMYPHEFLGEKYEYTLILEIAFLTGVIVFLRVYRAPVSCLIQASGQFKPLAKIVIVSGCIAIFSVVILSFTFGVSGSMYGIIISEVGLCMLMTKLKGKIKNYER